MERNKLLDACIDAKDYLDKVIELDGSDSVDEECTRELHSQLTRVINENTKGDNNET